MQCSTLLHNARLHSTVQVHQRREHPELLQGTLRDAQEHADCWHATPGRDSLGHTPSTSDNHLQQEPQFAASQCPPCRAGSGHCQQCSSTQQIWAAGAQEDAAADGSCDCPTCSSHGVLLHTCTPPDTHHTTCTNTHTHTHETHTDHDSELHGSCGTHSRGCCTPPIPPSSWCHQRQAISQSGSHANPWVKGPTRRPLPCQGITTNRSALLPHAAPGLAHGAAAPRRQLSGVQYHEKSSCHCHCQC